MPEYLFSWPVFNSTLVWALALHFADLLNNVVGNYFQRFLIILVMHLLLFSALFLLKKLLFDNLQPIKVPAFLFFSIALLGTGRGVFLQYLLIRYNSTQESSYGLRMWASFLNTTSSFVIATITLGIIRTQFSKRNRFLVEKDRLEYVQVSAKKSLASVSPDVIVGIKSNLLEKVSKMLGSKASEVLPQIQLTIDEVVRPLSKSLDEKVKAWVPPVIESKNFQVNWADAFRESIRPTQINYNVVPIMMTIVALPTILQRTSPIIAFPALVIISGTGVLWGVLVNKFLAPKFSSALSYFIFTLLNGGVMGLLTLTFTQDYDEPFGLLLLALIFFPLSSFVISFLTTSILLDRETNLQLEEITANLAWNVARAREQHFHMQKNLATTLHGEVQAKLASTYLQIQSLVASGQDGPEKVRPLLKQLQAVIEKIDQPNSAGNDLQEMLEKVKNNWLQVAEISLNVAPNLLRRIEQDKVCANTLAEIIPELCFNGIKHGNASKISISLSLKTPRIIYLEVGNNGKSMQSTSSEGLGSKFLNEASISWERVEQKGQTVTKAEFAFSPNEQLIQRT